MTVVILNWNGWHETEPCLESLRGLDYGNLDIVVVDNGSTDSSLDSIRRYARQGGSRGGAPMPLVEMPVGEVAPLSDMRERIGWPGLTLLVNPTNEGYAGGNNVGIAYALDVLRTDYVLLLNNDTLAEPGFLRRLVDKAESDPSIGYVGPKVLDFAREGVIQFAGGGTVSLWRGSAQPLGWYVKDRGQWDVDQDVDYVGGACLLARAEALCAAGRLDPDLFLYWEETDMCLRGAKAGFRSVYSYEARIVHKGGATSGVRTHAYYFTRNMFHFVRRHGGRGERAAFAVWFWGFRFWWRLAAYLIIQRSPSACVAFLEGVRDGCFRRRVGRRPAG